MVQSSSLEQGSKAVCEFPNSATLVGQPRRTHANESMTSVVHVSLERQDKDKKEFVFGDAPLTYLRPVLPLYLSNNLMQCSVVPHTYSLKRFTS